MQEDAFHYLRIVTTTINVNAVVVRMMAVGSMGMVMRGTTVRVSMGSPAMRMAVPMLEGPPKKDSKSSAKQPQKTQKKKEGSGGGKAKKKKWSKGKVRDKLNNQVLFDKATYEKLYKEVPSYKLITPSVVSERLKVRGSLARRALIELQQKGLIKQVVQHRAQLIYTRTTKGDDPVA
ncbi:hypothetical protein NQ315_009476 [Exocentrus adspersus]|uniref:40S ribosomal protein S25 n=1 Tax=Exocentrus adspersus TaxID=1586481 RepID=A0AAV8WIR4_9CUCU|nr:hypothetical protein NQ315_009476 [Exocentrus adspersus]